MPYIKVDTRRLSNFGNVASSTKSRVGNIKSSFSSIGSSLDWDVKACSGINRTISQINNELSAEMSSLMRIESFFDLAVRKYNDAEKSKEKLSKIPQTRLSNANSDTSISTANANVALNSILKNNALRTTKEVETIQRPTIRERIANLFKEGTTNGLDILFGEGEIHNFAGISLFGLHVFGDPILSDAALKVSRNVPVMAAVEVLSKSVKPLELIQKGLRIVKNGDYYIVKITNAGKALGHSTLKAGRYAVKNASRFGEAFKGINIWAALNDANSLKSISSKLVAAGMFIETGIGVYENVKEGESVQHVAADATVDLAIGTGSIFASAAAGAAVGSIIPGPGTAIGAAVGAVAGIAASVGTTVLIDHVTKKVEWKVFGGKTIRQVASEKVEWVINKAGEGLSIAKEAAIDVAQKVGNGIMVGAAKAKTAVVEFGKTVVETAEAVKDVAVEKVIDAGNAIGSFAYETGNAIKTGFLNGVSNIKNVVTGKAIGFSW